MLRSKNLIIVSHCVLNQNSVVSPLARARGVFEFVSHLIEEGIGIIQLPCPELRYLGITRKPMEKEEYDTLEYRNLCKELFSPVMKELENYIKNGYTIKGIIAINESPTCSISGKTGIFMEEILKQFEEREIKLKYIEVPSYYDDKRDSEKLFNEIRSMKLV